MNPALPPRAFSLLLCAALACAPAPPPTSPKAAPPLDTLVDGSIGTGGFGFAYGASFLGAAAPHGLAKVGPDTTGDFGEARFLHTSGNWANDETVLCFSHFHLHGTGLPEGGVLALMPTTSFDPENPQADDYRATRTDERARAGRYSVRLVEPDIAVELAAPAVHSVSWRVTFPEGTADATLVLDLFRTLIEGEVTAAHVNVEDDADGQRLSGSLHTVGSLSPPGGYDVYFIVAPREPFSFIETARGGALSFGARGPDAPVELHVSLSLVDVDGARANLAAELPASATHDDALARASEAWREIVNRVRVWGGAEREQTMLASSIYRAFLMPTVMSDVDGRYRIGERIDTAQGFRMMTDLSLWDTYRTVQPLYALVAPEAARDVAISLVRFTEALGFSPLWPMATGDASVMIGSPTEIVLGDAVARGVVDGDDVRPAWPVLRDAILGDEEPTAGRGGRNGAPSYRAAGGVQRAPMRAPVSATLELNAADLALSRVADAIGESTDAEALRALSVGWRSLYDEGSGFLRGRDETGAWAIPAEDFFPEDFSDDYVEADAWQSMFPIDDVEGVELVYGDANARLEELLTRTEEHWDSIDPHGDTFGLQPLPFHWQGNEPSLHVSSLPYLLGDDALGARYVRWVMTTQYGPGVDGVPGNDDGGATSSWWAMAALGLFPIAGGDGWALGAPWFDRAEIDTAGGTLAVERATSGPARLLDGDQVGARVSHAELVGARTLTIHIAE